MELYMDFLILNLNTVFFKYKKSLCLCAFVTLCLSSYKIFNLLFIFEPYFITKEQNKGIVYTCKCKKLLYKNNIGASYMQKIPERTLYSL